MPEIEERSLLRGVQAALMGVLAVSVAWFVLKTIHWPLTGDASLIHYVAF